MKQKLLLSELDIKQLRDKVQHLQNELIRVSWGLGGRGPGEPRGKQLRWECAEKCLEAEGRALEGTGHTPEDSGEGPGWTL